LIEPKNIEAIEERAEKEKVIVKADLINLFNQNKLEIVNKFYEQQPFFFDKATIFWLWQENRYLMVDEYDLLKELMNGSQNKDEAIKNSFWTEIMRAFKVTGRMNEPKESKKSWIQFKDIIIDWKTGENIQISHEYFNVNPIPWNPIKGNTTQINAIFESWVGKEYVQTLKEIIAYCLIQDYPLHRIFCLTGSGLNGKGVYQSLIRKIIGHENIVSTELDLLADNRFESSKLYKKLVCQMGETNFSEMSKTSMLKKLSGQDLIGIEFKNKNPFDTVNYAKLIINTNSLPPTTDKTDGFYRRWMIIDFPNKFPEGVDVLAKIPDYEIEALLYECLELLPNILINGKFYNEGNIEERKKRYEDKSNPINSFIKENYKKNFNGKVPLFEFDDKFNIYLSERGLRKVTRKQIGLILKNEGFELERENVKNLDNTWTKWTFIYGLDSLDALDSGFISPIHTEGKCNSLSNVPEVSKLDDLLFPFIKESKKGVLVSYLYQLVKSFSIGNEGNIFTENDLNIWIQKKKANGEIIENPANYIKIL